MSPLITVDELRALDPQPVLIDATWNLAGPPGREAYDAGHLPGAYFVDLDTELAGPPGPGRHPLPDATTVTATFARVGITSADTPVVVYDAANSMSAARARWIFRYYGLTNVKVLDGGLAAWQSSGGQLTPAQPAPPADATSAPPPDATSAPPADATSAPPPDATSAPPADATSAPPADATSAPPADATSAPPADATSAPPAGSTTGSTTAPAAGSTTAPAAGSTTAPAAGSTTGSTTGSAAGLNNNSAAAGRTSDNVPGGFVATPGHLPMLDADGAAAVAAKGILLDARAPERFAGEVEPMDPVAGHIPGAVNAPTTANVDESGHFLPAADLRTRFTTLGATPDTEVAVYCGSGVTAAHEALALESAGIPATVYIGSWSEWITDPTRPVATGKD